METLNTKGGLRLGADPVQQLGSPSWGIFALQLAPSKGYYCGVI